MTLTSSTLESVSGNRYSITNNKQRTEDMQVQVTDNKMETITYGYSPEHYAGVVEFYSDLVQSGEIYTYTVKM
jgi:predicted solute-binding protein